MRNKKFKILCTLVLVSQLLCGCSIGGQKVVLTSGVSKNEVFKIDGQKCSVKTAKVYLANNQNIYGKSYGIDLWEQNYKTDELEEYVKDITLEQMTKVVCMDLLAAERGITLSEEESAKAMARAKNYFESLNAAELEYMGVDEADIVKIYENRALARKLYDSLTQSVNEEVSDDEARVMQALVIFVKEKSTAKQVKKQLQAGEDFLTVANNYDEAGNIDRTFARGELPKIVEDYAYALENDEVSSMIETTEGYYFLKCINKFNQELTDINKEKIAKAREKAAFDDVYEAFVATLPSNFNEKIWNEITLQTDGSITTDSLFELEDE